MLPARPATVLPDGGETDRIAGAMSIKHFEIMLRRGRMPPMGFATHFRAVLALLFCAATAFAGASAADAASCSTDLNTPQAPFRIYGKTWYVGTHGVASILIAPDKAGSDKGLVLIDGDLAQSVPQITANIAALGFRLKDVKLILNTHVHCDHAGGIAELQRLTGAAVKASPSSAAVLSHGGAGRDDPQWGIEAPIAPVANVSTLTDGETLKVGSIAVTAHFTPGHTPGGTSWTWVSCERARCLHIVYADSLSVVSAPDFRFTDSAAYPQALGDFEKSFAVLSALPCDILITVHPEFNALWTRLERRNTGDADALVDTTACRAYVDAARMSLAKRVAKEKAKP
jgi:metallo-beta-lactamase class B